MVPSTASMYVQGTAVMPLSTSCPPRDVRRRIGTNTSPTLVHAGAPAFCGRAAPRGFRNHYRLRAVGIDDVMELKRRYDLVEHSFVRDQWRTLGKSVAQ